MDALVFEDLGDGEWVIDTSNLRKDMIIKIEPKMLKFFEEKIRDNMLFPFVFKRHGCIKDEVKLEVTGYLFKVVSE